MEELLDYTSYVKASNADGVAIIEATTTWCIQCKAIAPFVEKMIKKYPEARFYNYDTDSVSAGAIAQELGVISMPTFHVFKDGVFAQSVTGAKTAALEQAIKSNYEGTVHENAA